MNLTLKILFIEDSAEDCFLIANLLKKEFDNLDSRRVDTMDALSNTLSEFFPDIVICDHSLPGFSSLEVLNQIKTLNDSIPFILVTGAIQDVNALQAIKHGAFDYVLKSNLVRLPSVIKNALNRKESADFRVRAASELAKRKNELAKVNKELDSLVYSASHNLRSPLRSLLGLVNLAKSESNPDALRQYHEIMETSIRRLDDTVRDILEFSRSSRQALQVTKIDVRKIIEENFEKMAFMPEFKNFSTEISVDGAHNFFSDPYRISVIFNNLISNSIKYRDTDKLAHFIKVAVLVRDEKAIIDFYDNGIGIPENSLNHIFDMFFRATDKGEGSGLGLSIVKESVEMLDGSISVQSHLNEGTHFHIVIPNKKSALIQITGAKQLVDL